MTGRLDAFYDRVIAVIITEVPFHPRPPAQQDWTDVAHRLPTRLIYGLSFTGIAIYWNNHHHLLGRTAAISAGVMGTNLALSFWLSLMPVVTEGVGRASNSRWPAVAYGIISLASAHLPHLGARHLAGQPP